MLLETKSSTSDKRDEATISAPWQTTHPRRARRGNDFGPRQTTHLGRARRGNLMISARRRPLTRDERDDATISARGRPLTRDELDEATILACGRPLTERKNHIGPFQPRSAELCREIQLQTKNKNNKLKTNNVIRQMTNKTTANKVYK